MAGLIDAAEEILAWLEQHRRRVVDLLQPGLSENEIRASQTPFAPDSDVARLYRWHNGTRLSQEYPLDAHYFLPGYYFLSFDDALGTRRTYADTAWKAWFPLFANGGGDYYVVDQQNEQVLSFMHDAPNILPIYLDVPSMLTTIAACYRQGAYYVGADGYLEVNEELEKRVSRQHNPGMTYWGP